MFIFFCYIQDFPEYCCQHNKIEQSIQIAIIIDSRVSHLIIWPEHTAESLEHKKSQDDSVHDSLIQVLLLLFRKIGKIKTPKHNKVAKRPYIITSGKNHQKHHNCPKSERPLVQPRILFLYQYTDKRMNHYVAK